MGCDLVPALLLASPVVGITSSTGCTRCKHLRLGITAGQIPATDVSGSPVHTFAPKRPPELLGLDLVPALSLANTAGGSDRRRLA